MDPDSPHLRPAGSTVIYPDVPAGDADEGAWLDWTNAWPTVVGLGMRCTAVSESTAVFSVSSDPFVANPNGALNGGIVVAIADQGPGVLARRTSGPDHIGVTAALHIQYHQPVFAPFSVTVNRLPGGRRVQYYEIWFEDAQRGRVASAHATLVVTPVPALREIDDGPDAVPGVSDERNSEE